MTELYAGLEGRLNPFVAGMSSASLGETQTAHVGLGQAKLASDLPEILSGSNPLVRAANPLLNLVPQIRAMPQLPNPVGMRDYLVGEVKRFEQLARDSGATPETVMGARYCLCTVLDETAAQMPWGSGGEWGKHSLLVTFHNETWGGEKFFQLLAKLAQNPQQHRDLIELMYYCITLGFEGRYRIIDNGRTQLEALKVRVVEVLRTAKGEHARALSPHWQGVASAFNGKWRMIPFWVIATATALLALLIYLFFSFRLASLSDPVFSTISALRMPRLTISTPKPAATARLAKFLEPEIREQLVTVRDEADRSVVTLRGDGLFESASATVRDRYQPVLSRIADALTAVNGSVVVTGYTDNVPIRTVRFPSNWQLSQARAQTVKEFLDARLAAGRVRAEGRADADPLVPNDNAENRARNRRVEITLLLSPEEITRQINASSSGSGQ